MNCTYDNEREGGRRWEGEIEGWRWRIVRKDKEKNEGRTGKGDKMYRA